MFSGIVQTTARVLSVSRRASGAHVEIVKPSGWKLKEGQSINVEGICSTVVTHSAKSFSVDYMRTTLLKTTAKDFKAGTIVNLERSLSFGDSIDGHFVQGHVDGRGRVAAIVEIGNSKEIIVAVPPTIARRIHLHGSVSLNGVSLTVSRTKGALFTVAMIPYTLAHTTVGKLEVGGEVNIEVDAAVRYGVAAGKRSGRVKRHAKKRTRTKR